MSSAFGAGTLNFYPPQVSRGAPVDEARNRALCIHPAYRHRIDPIHFDDRKMRDEWQDEVYRYAWAMAVREGYRSVVDFGCGSGFKLMKYFSGFQTTGLEVEPALSHVRETYPNRAWERAPDLSDLWVSGDVLICADVIEHLVDPAALLNCLFCCPLRRIVLSTPALEILAERGESPRLGPPDNESHVNEWTTREFRDFCNMHLNVLEHVVFARQGTQMIVATPQ